MPTTYSGIATANSELQKNWSLGRYDTSLSYDLETMMTFLKSYFPINDDRFGGELPYRRAMYETSGKLVD